MTRLRILILLTTLVVVGVAGYLVILLARGYRFDPKTLKFNPNGILVIKSDPSSAQIFVDGDLKGATDTNLSLAPGVYDVDIKKDGFIAWSKRLVIEKEVVTEVNISLFKSTPALSPITFFGAASPVPSADLTRIAFAILPSNQVEKDKIGLWVVDTGALPLGFSRDPKRITDGDLTGATYQFSPSAREILLQTPSGVFLLDTGSFTPQSQRVNIASQKAATIASWEKERLNKLEAQIKTLPPLFQDILKRKSASFAFSFDESKILYTASASASLAENLTPPLPGSSTQKQNRNIIIDHTYVYDIKEDRNFLVDGSLSPAKRLFWLLNSKNLVLAEEGQITILDYDGTNRQTVYSGSYIAPHVFPFTDSSKLLILTSLGSSQPPNLYALNLK